MSWSTRAWEDTTASPDEVWALWADVAGWPAWDHEVVSAELRGPFEVGTTGELKPKGGPKSRFTITKLVKGHEFVMRSTLPFASLEFRHTMQRNGSRTRIEHEVIMTGPLTFVFKRLIGEKIAIGLPTAITTLARQAEGRR